MLSILVLHAAVWSASAILIAWPARRDGRAGELARAFDGPRVTDEDDEDDEDDDD